MENTLMGTMASSDQLPYSLESEQSILGSVLIDSSCVATVINELKADNFYRRQHRDIFLIVQQMFISGEPIDFITVLEKVGSQNIFADEQDARVYLTSLVQIVPTTSNINAYINIIRDKYALRSLIATFNRVSSASREGGADTAKLLEIAEQGIYDIRQGRQAGELVHISEALGATLDLLQKKSGEGRDEYLGIPTGYHRLDQMMTGLNRSDLIILAARPGMGKTAMALNIAVNVARQNRPVAVFSLEMSKEQLVERLLSSEAYVPSDRLRTGLIEREQWEALAVKTDELARLPIYLDDTGGTTVGDVKARVRRHRGISLIIIDYLQLMYGDRRAENRVQEVSEMTRALKIMAKQLNVPVLVLSQLSRQNERRADEYKRPMLSDLRDSGSIEQDADIVLFLYREVMYNPVTDNPGIAECIVSKNRHGTTGTVKLGWDGQHTKFSNLEHGYDEQ